MRKLVFAATATLALTFTAAALAQQHNPAMHDQPKHDPAKHDAMSHGEAGAAGPMSAPSTDGRRLVNFPPEMRDHQMMMMREHLQAVSDIVEALGAAQYEKAAGIARARLGLDSAGAAGCKAAEGGANASHDMSKHNMSGHDMHQMMARHMPEEMARLGMAMHSAASQFADTAEASAKSGDPKPAYGALAKVTAGCVGCHEAYRTR